MDKVLVIYYSFTGNSKKVAEYVKNKLNADILELEPTVPFSSDYDEVVAEWQNNEIKRDVEIKPIHTDLSQYKKIVLITSNSGAVITNEDKKLKAGMLGALSDFVILDPSYTLTVPMKQVISGAFDTLSHCMETYFGKPAENNISDEITEAIMRNVIRNIREVIKHPEDVTVRSELMWDSCIAECGLLKLGKITDFQAHQILLECL